MNEERKTGAEIAAPIDNVPEQAPDETTEAPPPPAKIWNGRAIEYHEVSYGVMKRIRQINETDREQAMLTLLVASLFYVDDGKKVFPKGVSEIDELPAKMTHLLIRHAGECMKINIPSDDPNG